MREQQTRVTKSDRREQKLRNFGKLVGSIFILLGSIALWRGRTWGWGACVVGLALVLFGLFNPNKLDFIEKKWMLLGEWMGGIMTVILLSLTYLVVITPMGMLARLFGGDLLKTRINRDVETYWVPVETDGPGSRPKLPY